ncbi:hypothetical protein QMG83_10550 [Salinibacterium sp. G-O1]|uniref:hypothetical protein n=1 Tax=Salinibacterium sp. G-O1 TaxID=3046208 RepID=UPI0024BB02BE|nr:hypothetical protein [Salinibacterium sp. G-O1]MDJ0335662.1 hypothetical protein [Salinibacterium sp. G-O1]
MRFVLAIISFVLAAVMIGAGIAQRTVFAEPDQAVLTTSVSTKSAVTVIDGAALNAYDGNQSLTISGADKIFAAYGRTTDVLAWVGDTTHNEIGFDPETLELTDTLVRGAESEVPNPAGSDLWLNEYERDRELSLRVSVPSDFSFVVVSDGVEPAAGTVSLAWPLDNATPFSGPLIVGGAVALLLGLLFLLWAITHMRKLRGPRRKQLKMPKVPKKPSYKLPRKSIAKPAVGRRSLGRGMIAAPLLLAGTLVLSGCTSGVLTTENASSKPTPSASATTAAAVADPPAVTVSQAERIIADVSKVAAAADEAKDATLLATRFDGAALELRTANYAIVSADPTLATLPAIPAGPVKLTLPQQTDTWPRTVFAVIQDDTDDTIPSIALFLEQADAREPYKVMYAVTLEPSQKIPDVAQADVGAARLLPDSPVLRLTPTEIALAYADILDKDVDSEFYDQFEAEGDSLRTAVGPAYKESVRQALPTTASVAFASGIGEADAISLATNDAGALIVVNLNETTTVAPIEEGAAVNTSGQVKALSGLAVSSKGVVATYGDQLLFYMPPTGSGEKIVLLGYTQGLVKAGEIG